MIFCRAEGVWYYDFGQGDNGDENGQDDGDNDGDDGDS